MTSSLGPAGFFALEAGECLDRLESMFTAADGPPADDFVRTARVLRGSALMANLPLLARTAAGFEALARAYRDRTRAWEPATREQASQAVEEFRALVRRVADWQESDAARAAQLAAQLESLAGQGPLEADRVRRMGAAGADLQTGVRAFVAREGALIASALDRAARAFRAQPEDREPLYMVLRRMQSLQGLAELPELPPLSDVLDGIELAVGDLSRLHAPPPGVEEVLTAGALALSRIARDIAERGLPDPEAEEPRKFTALLLDAFAVERDVVPIESLYRAGDPNPLRQAPGTPRFEPPSPAGSLELVSLGEHLVQTAGLIERAAGGSELDLRLYRLVGTLRSAASPQADPIGEALGSLARAAREAVATGAAKSERGDFAAALRETGELLRAAGAGLDRARLARRIEDAAGRLAGLRRTAKEPPRPAIEEPPVVPIDALAPDGAPAAPPTALESALTGYQRLVREQGGGEASLDGLVGRAAEEPVVPIESLCYRGRRALERAAEVRCQIEEQLLITPDLARVRPLLQELLDLVPLALAESD
jgi:HPt (histidine-containing phosphotransfer) domain-containing protein